MRTSRLAVSSLLAILVTGAPSSSGWAEESDEEIARDLANPIANRVSVPFLSTYECCIGTAKTYKYTLNIEPVIPFALTEDWSLIVRTIVPVIYDEAPSATSDSSFGLGDTTQSFFLSPSSSQDGMTWGVGPVFLWPSATESDLGAQKWGAGPTGILMLQDGRWSTGILANQIWSYAGDEDRKAYNSTFLQPFLTYTFPNTVALTLNTESTYDWIDRTWSVPIDAGISKIFRVNGQRVSLGVQGRYFASSPNDGPEWAARFKATLVFPK